MRDLLSPAALQRRGLFDVAYVGKLINQHESGFADHGMLLWGLMSVEIWQQLFIDSCSAVQASVGAQLPLVAQF